MELLIEKCAIFRMNSVKETADGIELPTSKLSDGLGKVEI